MSPGRPISNELINRGLVFLMYYNKDARNKNLTPTTNDLDKNTTCSAIGCNEYANSNITFTAAWRVQFKSMPKLQNYYNILSSNVEYNISTNEPICHNIDFHNPCSINLALQYKRN